MMFGSTEMMDMMMCMSMMCGMRIFAAENRCPTLISD